MEWAVFATLVVIYGHHIACAIKAFNKLQRVTRRDHATAHTTAARAAVLRQLAPTIIRRHNDMNGYTEEEILALLQNLQFATRNQENPASGKVNWQKEGF